MKKIISQFNFLTKIIIVILFAFVFSIFFADVTKANYWVNNPYNCPIEYGPEMVSCSDGNIICGISGAACISPSLLVTSTVDSAPSITNHSSSFDGGYILNCLATRDSTSPYCDNNGNYWCDRNEDYYKNKKRTTVCKAGTWAGGGEGVSYKIGVCLSGYHDCDGDAGQICEIQDNTYCETSEGLPGVYSGCNGLEGLCVPNIIEFKTGVETSYYTTSSPLLWGVQNGTGELIRFSNSSTQNVFVVHNDGVLEIASTSAPATTTNKLYNVGGTLYWNGVELGGGTPAGNNKEIQFNNDGSFGASPAFVWDNVNGRLGIGTDSPSAKLTLEGDGAIVARGSFGSGWDAREDYLDYDYESLMMWVPSKAAFRAGGVGYGLSHWYGSYIGDYSASFGYNNASFGDRSFSGGGYGNSAIGVNTAIVGGNNNQTRDSSDDSFIGGGSYSDIYGNNSAIIGGDGNNIFGDYSAIIGGLGNTVSGDISVAFGRNMTVSGDNSFGINLYGDITSRDLSQDNTMAIMGGKVGIGTTTPDSLLSVHSSSGSTNLFKVSTTTNNSIFNIDNSGKVGIGTTNPDAKLTLDNDGAILAKGAYGDGWDGGTLGAGTRMMWVPNKVAFRAGVVTGTQWDNINIGNGSVAFGDNVISSGVLSFAMGSRNVASGQLSFIAGGFNNTSTASYSSIIAGSENVVSGLRSVIAGGYNNFINTGSLNSFIGGGRDNIVSGSNSVAFGQEMTVSGANSFGINLNDPASQVTLSQSNTFGIFNGGFLASGITGDTPVSGAGTRMMWVPSKSAFRAGRVTGDQWDNSNIGSHSVAFGYKNTASGEYSFIGSGSENSATGTHSTVFGRLGIASGDYSFIGGGYDNRASKMHSFIGGGINNRAYGHASFIGGGVANQVTATNSVAFGREITVSGNYSFGVNLNDPSSQIELSQSNTFGIFNGGFLASGTTGDTPVSGAGTRMMWIPSKSAFRAGTVEGTQWDNSNIGNYSTVFGENNIAKGIGSFIAGGELNNASSTYAFITGQGNQILKGDHSSILGGNTNIINTYYGNNFIIGGWLNTVTGTTIGTSPYYSGIIGGAQNTIGGNMIGESIIIGGISNRIYGGVRSTIISGYSNEITGSNSTIISGYTSSITGSNSTAVGYGSRVTGNNTVGINLSGGTNVTFSQDNSMVIMNGKVGIGTTTPQYALEVKSNTTNIARFTGSNSSSCTLNSTNGILSCSSDIRLKKNITEITGQLENIMNLNPVLYNWNSQSDLETKNASFIAQELEEIYPNLVMTEDDESAYKSISMIGMIPYIVSAIQEQQNQISAISVMGTSSQSIFSSSTFVDDLTIEGDINFIAKAEFKSHIYFSENNIGRAKILPGFDKVRITFTDDYTVEPVITVTPIGLYNFNYGVDKIDINGFEIVISEAQDEEVVFNWHSFATNKLKMFISDGMVEVLYDSENILLNPEDIFFENSEETGGEGVVEPGDDFTGEGDEVLEESSTSTESNLDNTSSTDSNIGEENPEEIIEDFSSSSDSNLDNTSSTESNL